VTEIGKTGAGNEADIAGANHSHAHCCSRVISDAIRGRLGRTA
jgi:hypothetical protein